MGIISSRVKWEGIKLITGLINFFFNPETEVKKEIKNADFVTALKNYTIVPVILALIAGIILAAVGQMAKTMAQQMMLVDPESAIQFMAIGAVSDWLGIAAIIVLPVVTFILIVVLSLIGTLIMQFIAKLMGNEKNFMELYYVLSVYSISSMVVFIIAGIIAAVLFVIGIVLMIVFIGIVLLIAAYAILIALSIYMYYVFWVTLKELFKTDNMTVMKIMVATMTVTMVIIAVIAIILVVALAFSIAGSMGALTPNMLPTGLFGM